MLNYRPKIIVYRVLSFWDRVCIEIHDTLYRVYTTFSCLVFQTLVPTPFWPLLTDQLFVIVIKLIIYNTIMMNWWPLVILILCIQSHWQIYYIKGVSRFCQRKSLSFNCLQEYNKFIICRIMLSSDLYYMIPLIHNSSVWFVLNHYALVV